MYLQHYTPTIKPMQDRVPLAPRPHLLTFLLGSEYVRQRPKFRAVWDEVQSERSRLELLEVCSAHVPMEARLEVVITENDPSFLSSFRHRTIARLLAVDRLLVKVRVSE